MELETAIESLIWGDFKGDGDAFEVVSPLDGSLIAGGQMQATFDDLWRTDLPGSLDFADIGAALVLGIERRRAEFAAALRSETGFIHSDCEEMVEGAIAYARGYAAHPSTQLQLPSAPEFFGNGRRMGLVGVPFGTMAAILPHNAFLPLALACMLNALRAGNRVILRSPTQSARSAALFGAVLREIPEIAPWVSVLLCSARPFVDAFMAAPGSGLLQFFGSSRRAGELTARGFDAGKTVLVDGEGNAWVYVDSRYPVEKAAELLVGGAFRYNGQTCTSINGAVIHPEIFDVVAARIVERAAALQFGEDVGPLFDEAQAEWCLGRIRESGGEVLAGGTRDGAFLAPTVVKNPLPDSELVREGLFGPAFWIVPGDAASFAGLWGRNRFPLCAGVLQSPPDPVVWTARLPGLARLVLNGDPSVEDPFEYWGGYAPSGQNPVSAWPAKYRRVVQVDLPE